MELRLTAADNTTERATYSTTDGEAWLVVPYDKLEREDDALPASLVLVEAHHGVGRMID